MRINTKIVLDIVTYKVLERESFEYFGPVAQCCGGGGPGGPSGDVGMGNDPSTGNISGQSIGDMSGMESAEAGQDTAPTPRRQSCGG